MLHKGHAPSLGIPLIAALAILLASVLAIEASAAPIAPIGGVSSSQYDALGRVSRHTYIGHTLPPIPKTVGTAQGSGPVPDANLTPTAQASAECAPHGAPSRLTNRVTFSSVGVDLDENGQIDTTLPDDPDFTPNHNIWIMRPDGSEQVQLTDKPDDEVEPCYGPGGNIIAFAGNQTGRWEIYVFEVRSPNVISCLTDKQPGNKRHPTWSPDGNWIAYQCDAAGNWDIYKLPATGAANQTRLTTSAGDDTDPAWVPSSAGSGGLSGQGIAYTAASGAVTRINIVNALTQDIDTLTDGGGDGLASDREPAWSKDGNLLAFASNRLTESDLQRDYNIWRMGGIGEVLGTPATLVSNLNAADTTDDRNPAWSAIPADTQEPLRIYYESLRADAVGAEQDIWATLYADIDPPQLSGLPFTTTGNESAPRARVFTPGTDVYFHVRVFDEDSGVQHVRVRIKDPDQKAYSWTSSYWEGTSTLLGNTANEFDCATVATVELFDDGDADNGDLVAGDGMFGGYWSAPLGEASDYIIDVTVTDLVTNSMNYDSVYGFTTEVFSPKGNVLFVNDYCEGQRFIYDLGIFRNNDSFAGWHCESFYLDNPSFSPEASAPDFHSIEDYPRSLGQSEVPDVWRVICRGPIPSSVYQYYLPTVEYQLDPLEAVESPEDAAPTRAVQVANRAVIWAAPHTGDVWVADGSIIDAGTQADLGLFLDRGGRLMISGGDLAWALTLNGSVSNDFLSRYLRASFVRDSVDSVGLPVIGQQITGRGGDPVTTQTFGGHYGSADQPLDLITGSAGLYRDSHYYSWYPDVIQEQTSGEVVKLYAYGSSIDGATAGLRYEDATSTARVIYLAFGFETIYRDYVQDPTWRCLNHRSHLIHNALCWTRTGGFRGRVLAIDDGKPINDPNPVVLVWPGYHPPGDRTTPPTYAVRCQDDGRYRLQGVPSGFYTLEACRPGYEIDHRDQRTTHGGWEPDILNFAISRARPGVVAGIVTSEATSEPLALVHVTAYAVPEEEEEEEEAESAQTNGEEPDWDTLFGPLGEATTAVDGSYKIEDLPPGDYYIRAEGSEINYGDAWAQITITAGNTTAQNFQLPAADGTLVASVTNAVDSSAIYNARVDVKTAAGLQVGTGTTDNTGSVEIAVQPGTYAVTVSAGGFQIPSAKSAAVVSNETQTVAFALQPEPPGSISGKIVSATTGGPVGGVLVRLLSNDVPIATTTTTAELVNPGSGQVAYNYRFDNVPTGSNTVRPAPVGFTATPTERVVTVESGVLTPNVNFTLNSLHVFPSGLQLVSFPYDYSTIDPALVLNMTADELRMATWEASRQRYRLYPQTPADRFRLGTGYWMRLDSARDVITQGTDAPDPMPVALGTGWNLVGDPFPVVVDFYSALVEDQSGVVRTIQQALSEGLLEGGMFAYTLGGYQNTAVFSPWVGTWLKASKDLTLHISRTTGALSAETAGHPAVAAPAGGWVTSIQTSVDGLVDGATHFGMAKSATDGYDVGLDMGKPPAVDFDDTPYVYAAFCNDSWGARSGDYAVDVRPADAKKAQWRLRVSTSQAGSDVTLRWPDLSSVDASIRPVLTDVATGKTVFMRTAAGYTYRAEGKAREFTISAGSADAGMVVVTGLSAQQVREGASQIVYTLAKDAAVDVAILNIGGRVVRQVCAGEAQAAGANTVSWNGRNEAGTKAPRGRYLVRVTARGDDGQQATAVGTLMVGR